MWRGCWLLLVASSAWSLCSLELVLVSWLLDSHITGWHSALPAVQTTRADDAAHSAHRSESGAELRCCAARSALLLHCSVVRRNGSDEDWGGRFGADRDSPASRDPSGAAAVRTAGAEMRDRRRQTRLRGRLKDPCICCSMSSPKVGTGDRHSKRGRALQGQHAPRTAGLGLAMAMGHQHTRGSILRPAVLVYTGYAR